MFGKPIKKLHPFVLVKPVKFDRHVRLFFALLRLFLYDPSLHKKMYQGVRLSVLSYDSTIAFVVDPVSVQILIGR